MPGIWCTPALVDREHALGAAGQEDRLVEPPVEVQRVSLHVVQRGVLVPRDLHAVEPGRLAVVDLANDVLEAVAEMARIEQNGLVRTGGEQRVGSFDERLVRDAPGHLLIDDHRVGRTERVANAFQQRRVGSRASLVEEPEVDAGLLPFVEVGLSERDGVEVLPLNDETAGVNTEPLELPGSSRPKMSSPITPTTWIDLGFSAARFATTFEAPPASSSAAGPPGPGVPSPRDLGPLGSSIQYASMQKSPYTATWVCSILPESL